MTATSRQHWAFKRRHLARAPYIELPPKPAPREEYLTKAQCQKVIASATKPHAKLALILMLGTGARSAALRGLTWGRCDFEKKLIDLRDPTIGRPHKGRAIVPMNQTVEKALLEAHKRAKSPFVIEWRGKPVKSLKRSFNAAGVKADAGHVWPHLLRHSAAVHMAEDKVPMEEIQQYMGHDDIGTTRKIYARFSPDYLRTAAASLEYDI